jgi:hypothetical protein
MSNAATITGRFGMARLTKVGTAVVALVCAVAVPPVQAAAPPGRYTTGTGTVQDTKTKLIWQQPAAPSTMTWAAAKTYCAGIGATLGGSGWRLPTIKELQTLVDASASSGVAIDATYFPKTPTIGFWSSTPASATPSYAWLLLFFNGGEGQADKAQTFQVRCVR